jgi:hypothetical protein
MGSIAGSSSRGIFRRDRHPSEEDPMSVVLAVVFMSGVIALLVGSIRAARAIRPLVAIRTDDRPVADEPVARRVLPGAVWLGIALYGLVLASAAMLLTA